MRRDFLPCIASIGTSILVPIESIRTFEGPRCLPTDSILYMHDLA